MLELVVLKVSYAILKGWGSRQPQLLAATISLYVCRNVVPGIFRSNPYSHTGTSSQEAP